MCAVERVHHRNESRTSRSPRKMTAPRKTAESMPMRAIGAELNAAAGDDADDDREHDQAEDVVDDRGAEDDLRLGRLQPAEVLEDPRGDADAGGAQRGADEQRDRGGSPGSSSRDGAKPKHERDHDADHGDRQRARTDGEHLLHRRLEPDHEQQQDDSEVREHPHRERQQHDARAVRRGEDGEHALADAAGRELRRREHLRRRLADREAGGPDAANSGRIASRCITRTNSGGPSQ